MSISRIFLIVLIFLPGCIYTFMYSDLLSLHALKLNVDTMLELFSQHRLLASFIFLMAYLLVCSFPTPLVAVLTMIGGVFFGFWIGILIVSFANALGGTIFFLSSRYLFGGCIKKKYSSRLGGLNQGLAGRGFWFACSLRLIPGIPFFVANVALSFSEMSAKKFYLSTQLGMFIPLAVFVNAGVQLREVDSFESIMNPNLIFALLFLGLLPFLSLGVQKLAGTGR